MRYLSQLPNILSISRIIASLLILQNTNNEKLLFILLIYCGLSDVLDGYLARKYGLVTKLGALIDSIADFVFYWIVVIYLLLERSELLIHYSIPLCLIILVRLSSILVCWIKNKRLYFLHTIANKLAGLLVFLIIFLMAFFPSELIITIGLLIILLTAIEELLIFIIIDNPDNDIRSILLRN
jgi:CDP-diacylglycerol--glycerol-3-phosphate 3-phosphatidyltransferase